MSIRVMTAVWEMDIPASDKLVLLALADCANDEGRCWPGLASLIRKTGRCRRSLQESLRSLDKAGHISRVENPGKGILYTVHFTSTGSKECTGGNKCTGSKIRSEPVAKSAPKPSRGTVIPKKDKPSLAARARKKPKKPAVALPKDWKPKPLTPGTICAGIVEAWQPGRIERELSKFKDSHLRKGARWSDWDAAWRTWIQHSVDFERGQDDGRSGIGMGGHQPAGGLGVTARAAIAVFGPPPARGAEQ